MNHAPLHRLLARSVAAVVLAAAVAAPVLATATSADAATSYRSPMCRTAQLRGALVSDGGGAAGSVEDAIRFTNTGARACTLQGWPGVSLVGRGNGTQIGAAARQYRQSLHPTVTLRPRSSAIAPLRIAQALNYPTAACRPVRTDGFRVYSPGERAALFVRASGITGCLNPRTPLLEISAVRPER